MSPNVACTKDETSGRGDRRRRAPWQMWITELWRKRLLLSPTRRYAP